MENKITKRGGAATPDQSGAAPTHTTEKNPWHRTKVSLQSSNNNGVYIAKDVHTCGAKNFRGFDTLDEMVSFVTTSRYQHLYEVTHNSPVFVHFDVDRPSTAAHSELDIFIVHFERLFEAFIRSLSAPAPAPSLATFKMALGDTYQVSSACTDTKLSAHIRVNLVCDDMTTMKALHTQFQTYVEKTDIDCDRFSYYEKNNEEQRKCKSMLDASIYRSFGCMRMLNQAKLGKENHLRPYSTSSKDLRHHLVYYGADEPDITIAMLSISTPTPAPTRAPATQILAAGGRIFRGFPLAEQNFNMHDVANVEEWLTTSGEIATLLKARIVIRNIIPLRDNYYILSLDKECKHTCPYANRVHRSNTSYFQYHWPTNTVQYKCHNETCKRVQSTDGIHIQLIEPKDIWSSAAYSKSLHGPCSWAEEYQEPRMREYPLRPLVCVRANMGTGKTKALESLLSKHPRATALLISYQVILCRKYAVTLKPHGFTSYLDAEADYLSDPRIIVCLDSLWKVAQRKYDFVIIDEALSVLLHMNSPLMKQAAYVSSILEVILKKSQHVYVLDAAVDHPLIQEFMTELALKRHQPTYNIINTYVRPTNRIAYIIRSTILKQRAALKLTAMDHVIQSLKANKKVVVSSSQRQFVEELSALIRRVLPQIRVLVYHSGHTNKQAMAEEMMDTKKSWSAADCLMYSPSISAGVSYEETHFDELIAYIENSPMTPTVDVVLQQLFRVRALRDGTMTLYVQDTKPSPEHELPTSLADIDRFLSKDIANIQVYFPEDTLSIATVVGTKIDDDGNICYDKSRMSYSILKGIVYAKSNSQSDFTDIIENTLENDYHIPVSIDEFYLKNIVDDIVDTLAAITEERKTEAQALSDSLAQTANPYIISDTAKADIEVRRIRGESVTAAEIQDAWAHDVVHKIYAVDPAKLDAAFMTKYVGVYNDKTPKKTMESLFTFKRLDDYLGASFEDNRRRFYMKMRNPVCTYTEVDEDEDHDEDQDQNQDQDQEDRNILLFKTQLKRYYKMLLEAQYMLDFLFRSEVTPKDVLSRGKSIRINHTTLVERFGEYMAALDDAHYGNVIKIFGMRKYFKTRDTILGRKIRSFISHIVANAIGMTVISTNNFKKGPQYAVYEFSIVSVLELKTQYGSKAFKFDTISRPFEFNEEVEEYVSEDEDANEE